MVILTDHLGYEAGCRHARIGIDFQQIGPVFPAEDKIHAHQSGASQPVKYSHGLILDDPCLGLRYGGGADLPAGSHVFGIVVKELVPRSGHYLDER